jgi:hypothetical protein
MIQCRFLKVEASSWTVKGLLCGTISDCDQSDSDTSGIIVSEGDYITLPGPRVYVIDYVNCNGTVRYVSPTNGVNDPIDITMEQAIEGLLLQCNLVA